MIGTTKQRIEDIVVETLAKNPHIQGPKLVELVSESRPKTSKQAIYTALQFLLQNETVAKAGSRYFLSRVWLNRINKLFEKEKEAEFSKDAIFSLNDTQSISYHFPSLLSCDTYWAHATNMLIDWMPKGSPAFIWNPHDFFVIGRNEVETDIFEKFRKQNKYGFFLIRGNTPLDKDFKKLWTTEHVSITIDDSLPFKDTYYLNIFEDFIIEIFIDPKLAEKIEIFYTTTEKLTPQKIQYFENILKENHPIRMKVSRNRKKAAVLRKQLSKDFFVPKHLRLDSNSV